jgi:hypothetical protein
MLHGQQGNLTSAIQRCVASEGGTQRVVETNFAEEFTRLPNTEYYKVTTNALARYALKLRGVYGGLCEISFGIHEGFPQLCADVARGQQVKIIKFVWESGRCYGQGLVEREVEEKEEHELDGVQAEKDVSEEQQNSPNVVCKPSLHMPLNRTQTCNQSYC